MGSSCGTLLEKLYRASAVFQGLLDAGCRTSCNSSSVRLSRARHGSATAVDFAGSAHRNLEWDASRVVQPNPAVPRNRYLCYIKAISRRRMAERSVFKSSYFPYGGVVIHQNVPTGLRVSYP
jgi:hypothetical protein